MPAIDFLSKAWFRFQQWFDARFGWFFTNGMKERAASGERMH